MQTLEESEQRAWELMRVEGHTLGGVMRYFGFLTDAERQEMSTALLLRETRLAQSAPVTPRKRGWRTGDDFTRAQPQH